VGGVTVRERESEQGIYWYFGLFVVPRLPLFGYRIISSVEVLVYYARSNFLEGLGFCAEVGGNCELNVT
jgi:hypothetical protein